MSTAKLGVLAGGGDAPKRLLAMLDAVQRPYTLLCIEGQADIDLPDGRPHVWLPLGAGAAARDAMRAAGAQDIVMIGRVRRPSLFELRPDFYTMQKLVQIGFAMLGDDGLLRGIAKIIEAEGFRVVGIQDVCADFLTPEGQLGSIVPSTQDILDVARGALVVRQLGTLDVGQAAVVQQGLVLGVEAIEGTDALIDRAGYLKRAGGGGVVVKLSKLQQDRRFDLPTWGVHTVTQVAAAGLAGIAVEAGASLLIDRTATIAAADEAGIFLLGYRDAAAAEHKP